LTAQKNSLLDKIKVSLKIFIMDIYNCISDIMSGVVVKKSVNSHISPLEGCLLQIGWDLQINDLNSGIQMVHIGNTDIVDKNNLNEYKNVIITNKI
jgi:hypothetical protein